MNPQSINGQYAPRGTSESTTCVLQTVMLSWPRSTASSALFQQTPACHAMLCCASAGMLANQSIKVYCQQL